MNFSARCDTSQLSRELINCGRNKGIVCLFHFCPSKIIICNNGTLISHLFCFCLKIIERPFTLIEEEHQYRRAGPLIRVEKMFEQIKVKLPGPPQFIMCVLPEKKNSDIYGM